MYLSVLSSCDSPSSSSSFLFSQDRSTQFLFVQNSLIDLSRSFFSFFDVSSSSHTLFASPPIIIFVPFFMLFSIMFSSFWKKLSFFVLSPLGSAWIPTIAIFSPPIVNSMISIVPSFFILISFTLHWFSKLFFTRIVVPFFLLWLLFLLCIFLSLFDIANSDMFFLTFPFFSTNETKFVYPGIAFLAISSSCCHPAHSCIIRMSISSLSNVSFIWFNFSSTDFCRFCVAILNVLLFFKGVGGSGAVYVFLGVFLFLFF